MMRKIIVLSAGVITMLVLGTGVASAQASPPSVLPTTTVQVQGVELVRTGTDSMPLVYLGLALAFAGIVLVVAARRRRRHHMALS